MCGIVLAFVDCGRRISRHGTPRRDPPSLDDWRLPRRSQRARVWPVRANLPAGNGAGVESPWAPGAKQNMEVPVFYRGVLLQQQRLDMLVDDRVVLELKATPALHPPARQQLLNYLRLTPYRVRLLLHFGPVRSFERVVHSANALDISARIRKSARFRAQAVVATSPRKQSATRPGLPAARRNLHSPRARTGIRRPGCTMDTPPRASPCMVAS